MIEIIGESASEPTVPDLTSGGVYVSRGLANGRDGVIYVLSQNEAAGRPDSGALVALVPFAGQIRTAGGVAPEYTVLTPIYQATSGGVMLDGILSQPPKQPERDEVVLITPNGEILRRQASAGQTRRRPAAISANVRISGERIVTNSRHWTDYNDSRTSSGNFTATISGAVTLNEYGSATVPLAISGGAEYRRNSNGSAEVMSGGIIGESTCRVEAGVVSAYNTFKVIRDSQTTVSGSASWTVSGGGYSGAYGFGFSAGCFSAVSGGVLVNAPTSGHFERIEGLGLRAQLEARRTAGAQYCLVMTSDTSGGSARSAFDDLAAAENYFSRTTSEIMAKTAVTSDLEIQSTNYNYEVEMQIISGGIQQ